MSAGLRADIPLPVGGPPGESWSAAYLRFETPAQERRKFRRRLLRLGAGAWPRDWLILELCCGRGNGLQALAELGFRPPLGLDLDPGLAARAPSGSLVVAGDCRRLPFAAGSFAAVVVHGGLHHLPAFPGDVEQALAEVERVLVPGGRFLAVEPWLTPYLRLVHRLLGSRLARRLYAPLDALAVMTVHERETYARWLGRPAEILALLERIFARERLLVGRGKLLFAGQKKA